MWSKGKAERSIGYESGCVYVWGRALLPHAFYYYFYLDDDSNLCTSSFSQEIMSVDSFAI
jgi:hypothetical protein